MSYPVKNGQTSVVLRFKLLDSSSLVGAGLTGLTSASSGLIISTIADNEVSATAYTVAGSTIEAVTTLGTYAAPTATKCRFKAVDATSHPGVYEFQFADARFAVASAKALLISVSGAANLAQADYVVPLVADDPQVAKVLTGDAFARLGAPAGASVSADIAALPSANANADALLDRANAVETGVTLRGLMRLLGAVMAGKLSGAGTGTEVFRNTVADSKNRITATVDASGNRTAISTDQT